MNNDHEFCFSREEIERQIDALCELDDLLMDALANDEDPRLHDAEAQRLRSYFECLADSLWKAGAFKSQQEARHFVRADVDVLQHVGGPGGLRPDDGTLNPDEIAEGLVALKAPNEFCFQAPICYLVPKPANFDYRTVADGTNIRLTSCYSDLSLPKMHPGLRSKEDGRDYLWMEGSIKAHRYDFVRPKVDLLVLSVMGVMEVLGLLRYRDFPVPSMDVSIGTKDHLNSGAYVDMISVRMSQQLVGLHIAPVDNEMDAARTDRDLLDYKLRILRRAMTDQRQSALAVRHACRMYLRSYETWITGEAAMFLTITLEGLLLDKRQKDDLSARLQDSYCILVGWFCR